MQTRSKAAPISMLGVGLCFFVKNHLSKTMNSFLSKLSKSTQLFSILVLLLFEF